MGTVQQSINRVGNRTGNLSIAIIELAIAAACWMAWDGSGPYGYQGHDPQPLLIMLGFVLPMFAAVHLIGYVAEKGGDGR